MVMTRLVLCLLLLSPIIASAEDFIFELYGLTGGERQAIAKGRISYSSADDIVSFTRQGATEAVHRELRFAPGFAVGVTDYGEQSPKGFGAWLKRRTSFISIDKYEGFSWEWYDRGVGSLYSKRQGDGRITVQVQPALGRYAMTRVEFLDDTAFQMNVAARGKPGEYTHELIIKAGSVLAFPASFPN